MRWYDLEPSVCMAISMIELADKQTQLKCAEHIINSAKRKDPSLGYMKRAALLNVQVLKYQRWYDKDEKISMAFKYLKELPLEAQKEVSNEIFSLIKEVTLV